MNKYLEKIATTVSQYKHKKSGKMKWVKIGGDPGTDWVKTGVGKHIARKNMRVRKA